MNLTLTIVHKTKKMNNLLQIQGNVCSLHCQTVTITFLKDVCYQGFFPVPWYLVR